MAPRTRQQQADPDAAHDSLVGRRYELVVGPVAHGGSCVARHEGRVVFVRHALPGETVVAEITDGHEGARFLRADAVEIREASPDRVPAPCPHARPGGCGGCDWQHAAPAAQRRLKAAVIAEQFDRLAHLRVEVAVEEVPWPSGQAAPPGAEDGFGWRSRVQFAVDEQGRLGLRAHRSHQVIPVAACPLRTPSVAEVGAERRDWPEIAAVEVIAATGSGDRAVVVTPSESGRLPLVELDVPVSVFRGDGKGGASRVHGRPYVRERAAGRTWRVSGSGFWQVHPGAPDLLASAVLDALDPRPGERALDLYCGVGLFAGVLAPRLGPDGGVIAVEADDVAAADARHNLADLPTVEVVHSRVERALPSPATATSRGRGTDLAAADTLRARGTDLAVLDPPRAGAGRGVVEGVAACGPRRIAYVGCDPAALARDVATFAAVGYTLTGLRAFDLFPHTHHVECLAVLEPA